MHYCAIKKNDIANGPGVRVTLFISGCDHHCKGCHNPQTWDPEAGQIFDDAAYEQIFKELSKDYVAGITISGGDPLYAGNIRQIRPLLCLIRTNFPNKTIWLYTGYTWEQLWYDDKFDVEGGIVENQWRRAITVMCDVVVDGEYKESFRDLSLAFRGSSNQRLIDVAKTFSAEEVVLWES